MPIRDNSLEMQKNMENKSAVEFIQVRYTDVLGRFLARYIFSGNKNIHECCKSGVCLDGSSVRGFSDIDESDLMLIPDESTLRKVPMPDFDVAMGIADVYKGFGTGRLARDPRYVSQCAEIQLALEGLVCQAGPEVECFIFDDMVLGSREDSNGTRISSIEEEGRSKYSLRRKGGYDAPPFQDSLLEFRFEVADILQRHYSMNVTNLNHEVASSGQIEINFVHDTLTKAADNVQVYKDVVRNVAKKHNKVANFMPKPIFDENDRKAGDNGSGMHVNMSLWTRSQDKITDNIFYDSSDDYAEFSQTGRYFIGGLLNHSASLAALVAPTVNSYYRMVPGFEAPVYGAWSRANRSAIIRVPVNERGSPRSKRIEFRAPDPSANPYLAFSAIVLAGLDGIKKKIDPGDPVNENIYKMSGNQRNSLGIKPLPGSLQDSLDALKNDCKYLMPCFSNELLETYLILKEKELEEIKDGSKEQQFRMYHDV